MTSKLGGQRIWTFQDNLQEESGVVSAHMIEYLLENLQNCVDRQNVLDLDKDDIAEVIENIEIAWTNPAQKIENLKFHLEYNNDRTVKFFIQCSVLIRIFNAYILLIILKNESPGNGVNN